MRTISIPLIKSTILCTLLLLSIWANGQTVNTNYATQINKTFKGINKSKVPHKLLLDYAMEFAELSAYNGKLTKNNTVHKGTYTSIYNTLLMANVTARGVTGLLPPNTFKERWDKLRQPHKIVLSGLYYKYNPLCIMI